MEKVILLVLLLSSYMSLCSAATTHYNGRLGQPQISEPYYSNDAALSYEPAADQVYEVAQNVSEADTSEYFSFITGFHDIVLSTAAFQHSLTNPLVVLVQDPSAEQGVTICKLSRARMILSAGLNTLLESYHHWATLGTSLEEPHCKQDARESLRKFILEVQKASKDLVYMDAAALGTNPIDAFDKLKSYLVIIESEFSKATY